MKLAITNEEEIKSLMDLCNEIESFSKQLSVNNYDEINLEDDKDFYTVLYPLWKYSDRIETFMSEVFNQFDIVHFRKILWNCSTLLENCADPSLSYLDFNPDIKAGLEILETNEVFDNTNFKAIQVFKYKDKTYRVMSVNFEERLIGYYTENDDHLSWVRFENVEMIENDKTVNQ